MLLFDAMEDKVPKGGAILCPLIIPTNDLLCTGDLIGTDEVVAVPLEHVLMDTELYPLAEVPPLKDTLGKHTPGAPFVTVPWVLDTVVGFAELASSCIPVKEIGSDELLTILLPVVTLLTVL